MSALADRIMGRSPETLPTISELAAMVKAGRINMYGAAHQAMRRRDAGLCDYCSNKAEDEEGNPLCKSCREAL